MAATHTVSRSLPLRLGLTRGWITFRSMGTAYYLATEREDGTLLRAKAIPHGMGSYVVGLSVVAVLDTLIGVLIVLVPAMFALQVLWGWVQVAVQALPLYWLGIGLRSVFLPSEAVALEIFGSWRTVETVAVLGLWAAVGQVLGPILLRRMARRESGSAMEARREQALQRV